MSYRFLIALMLISGCVSGCAGKNARPDISVSDPVAQAEKNSKPSADETSATRHDSLAGRTLTVSSLNDLHLQQKEVVLTFDDGPMPGKTERILDILDTYHVKATFLMVGEMANSYPAIARAVVARGHSVGSHTYKHVDLRKIGFDRAMAEIMRGQRAVEHATGTNTGFFRFPYLSDTLQLRQTLARRGQVVLDVDVDSKDYFKNSPAAVAARTMGALKRHGHGIILLHDIHARTATMLPSLLAQLQAGGYRVVALRYRYGSSAHDLVASAAF